MDICEALYKHLSTHKPIKDLVDYKIYPIILPQNAVLPSIVYAPVNAYYDSALQGDTGFVRQTIQIVCHDKTYIKERNLSRQLRKEFKTFMATWEVFLLMRYLLNRIMM